MLASHPNNLLLQLAGLQPTSTKKEIEQGLQEWLAEHDIAAHCYWLLANQLGLSPLEDTPPENKARQIIEVWQTVLVAVVRQRQTYDELLSLDTVPGWLAEPDRARRGAA